MNNKRILITMISALIIEFLWWWHHIDLLSAFIVITGMAITGIIIYFLPQLKKNSSLSTKFKLLITYILGAGIAILFPSIYTVIAELFLFLMVIITTNRIKQIKGRITPA